MIQVEQLTKYYGAHPAIQNLSFTIERGEVIGFLGLNGAGKTTTLKILGCILIPTSGRVRIDGYDVLENPHEIRKRIGYLPDIPPLYEEMTVGSYLSFVAQLRGVEADAAADRVQKAEDRTGLSGVDREPVASLSHGFRQRLGVAQALVHNPALLILDEPTSGLDPVQTIEMRRLILGLKGAHTILVSSHILSEISQTCDRLLVIQAGEIVAQGTEAELARRLGGAGHIELEVQSPGERAVEVVRSVPGVQGAALHSQGEGVAVIRVEAPLDLRPALARALVNAEVGILRMERVTEKLESIFIKLTQGKEIRS